jgi:membrane-associated phospholipid phosphatase
MKNKTLTLLFLFLTCSISWAQTTKDSVKVDFKSDYHFNFKQIIIPTVLIGYGIWATDNDQLELINLEIKEEVGEHIDDKLSIDDFSQYAPLAATFSLDVFGIKGRHNLKDRAIIATTAIVLMGTVVTVIKHTSNVERPDGTSFTSFPSGHTATAFMGAELLYQEYKDVSVWYGISGYVIASGTGVFRMLNNRHWLSDVAAGAGIGILSAKVSYWLFPTISNWLGNEFNVKRTVFLPTYDGKTIGFGLVSQF